MFYKTNNHRSTDHFPFTHRPTEQLPTKLRYNGRPNSKYVLSSVIPENYETHLFPGKLKYLFISYYITE